MLHMLLSCQDRPHLLKICWDQGQGFEHEHEM